jgi:hypothetical protein
MNWKEEAEEREYEKKLRDRFAGQALSILVMQAYITRPAAIQIAESAYEIADAMLRVRSKK